MILLTDIKKNIINRLFFILIILNFPFTYESLDFEFLKESEENKEISNNSKKSSGKPNSFEKLIEGSVKKEGLFDYYWNENKNKCFLVINKNQLDKIFLLNVTRQTGDAYRYHGSAMGPRFTFSFKKVGPNIQIIQENLKFRAEKDSAIFKAITNNIPNSIFSVAKIESEKDSLLINI